jgi:hypothetical protein
MTSIIVDASVVISRSLAASIIVKATVTSVIALLLAGVARKSRASVHHLVFVAAFVTLAIIPIATIGLPAVQVPLTTKSAEASTFGALSAVDTGSVERVQKTVEEINAPINIIPRISVNDVLLAVWAAVALIFLLPVIAGLWEFVEAQRSSRRWLNGEQVAQQLAAGAGIRRDRCSCLT